MAKRELKLEGRRDGYYHNGSRYTNFTMELQAVRVNLQTGQRCYRLLFRIEDSLEVLQELGAKEINNGRWLEQFPVALWCEDDRGFTKVLRQVLSRAECMCEKIERFSSFAGFQKLGNKWRFLFTNGSITEEGFDSTVYADVTGCYYNGDCVWAEESETERYLQLIQRQAETLYPVLALNLMATTRLLFEEFGIDLGISLWLGGRSGSGKTSIAQTVGKNADSKITRYGENPNAWHERNVISSTERPGCLIRALINCGGDALIVDDIKDERTQRQREKSRDMTDITIRSVYQGTVAERASGRADDDETKVRTCAILTGQFRDTKEQQNARMIIVDVSGFLEDPGKAELLGQLEENLNWQANLIGGFIRWLVAKTLDSGIGEYWRGVIRELRRESWIYENRSNGQRLKETRVRFLFITRIFGEYLQERFPRLERTVSGFLYEGRKSIEAAILYTFENLHGIKAIALRMVKEILEDLFQSGEVREADFKKTVVGNDNYTSWDEEQFCLLQLEEANGNVHCQEGMLLIRELRKSFQRTDQEGEAVDERPLLVMTRQKLEELLEEKLNAYVKEKIISEAEKKRFSAPFLAQINVLLAWQETGRIGRYDRPYPMIRYCPDNEWDDDDKICGYGAVEQVKCVCFNPEHELIQEFLQNRFATLKTRIYLGRDEKNEASRMRCAFAKGRIRLKG